MTIGEMIACALVTALVASPFAFGLGMATGAIWVAVVSLAKELSESPAKRYGSQRPKEGE